MSLSRLTCLIVAVLVLIGNCHPLSACPFCSAVSLTFCEEIGGADVAVIAKLVQLPPEAKGNSLDLGKAKFEIVEVLKGGEDLAGAKKFETVYFGDSPVGTTFLAMGAEPPNISWSQPIVISERGREYLKKALKQPKEGPDRLAFFQDYLEDSDEMLSRDAYDEFAKAPYAGVKELKDRMKRDKLVKWIQDPKGAPSRRRLYLTMLGVCGTPRDAKLLEEMIRSNDRQAKLGLDALVAAYLTLEGPSGVKLVEDLFLKKQDADYTETYSTIMALRFHGQEEKIIPRPRLLEAIRYMLDRPQLADLVIPDLARWQDWSVMDKLVELFKNADDESSWVRVPVINYLRACPLPEAKKHLDDLAKIDPEAIKKANSFFPLGGAPAGRDKSAPTTEDDKSSTSDESNKDKKVSGQTSSAVTPEVKKTSQLNKPIIDAQASEDAEVEGDIEADQLAQAQSVAATPRLSRAAAPSLSQAAQVGALQVLGWMALVAVGIAVLLAAILRGGQETI